MRIAIASGKGGTGKTTIATNLAHVATEEGEAVCYLDCDVEEPNGHLFLKPEIKDSRKVGIPVPKVDQKKCTGCGLCAKICQYSAIICVKKKVLTFPELCHGCGGCSLVCPEGAIEEQDREIGVVEKGTADRIRFVHGKLRIGEAMSPPLIKAVKEEIGDSSINFIDVPPGTSCPVITAITDSDFVMLVTEPTPFGLNDLDLALDMVKELGLPHGVVVNMHEDENTSAREFCRDRGLPILAEIPDDRRVAEAYSRGELASKAVPDYGRRFLELWNCVKNAVDNSRLEKGTT